MTAAVWGRARGDVRAGARRRGRKRDDIGGVTPTISFINGEKARRTCRDRPVRHQRDHHLSRGRRRPRLVVVAVPVKAVRATLSAAQVPSPPAVPGQGGGARPSEAHRRDHRRASGVLSSPSPVQSEPLAREIAGQPWRQSWLQQRQTGQGSREREPATTPTSAPYVSTDVMGWRWRAHQNVIAVAHSVAWQVTPGHRAPTPRQPRACPPVLAPVMLLPSVTAAGSGMREALAPGRR